MPLRGSFYMGPGGQPQILIVQVRYRLSHLQTSKKADVGSGWYAMKETLKIKHRELSKLFFNMWRTHASFTHSITRCQALAQGQTLSAGQ